MGSDLAVSRCTCGYLDVDLVIPPRISDASFERNEDPKDIDRRCSLPRELLHTHAHAPGNYGLLLIIFKWISCRPRKRTRRAQVKCYSRYGCRRACVKRSSSQMSSSGRVRKRKRTREKEKICNNDCARSECCYCKGAKTG